jgi:hypothetical protein
MPLRRAPGPVYHSDDGVLFLMRDTQSGALVPCKISATTLSRVAGRVGSQRRAFDENRDTIEAIASRKYDAGETTPFLQFDDV